MIAFESFLGCNIYAVCGGICGLASIATMAAIALTRLAAVICPFSSLTLTAHLALSLSIDDIRHH
jgi:hypothetical protein